MARLMASFGLLAALTLVPQAAQAQDNVIGGALIGGGLGAIVGGAASGHVGGAVAGGVIGAAAGAMIGSQLEPRRGGYYWYQGRCYRKHRNGDYHRVPRDYCRR